MPTIVRDEMKRPKEKKRLLFIRSARKLLVNFPKPYEEDRTDNTDFRRRDDARRQEWLFDDRIALADDVVKGIANGDGGEYAPADAVELPLDDFRIGDLRDIRTGFEELPQ
jgi:hypothetical protein